MQLRICHLTAVVAALALGCERPEPAPAPQPPEIRYDGATTLANKVFPLALPILKERAGVRVRVDRSGAGKGLARMFAGEVDVAGVARSLTAAELQRKPYIQIIGYDALGVFVNEASGVRAVTRAQLRDLFTGHVASWKELGGRDVPVQPCVEHLDSGRATLAAFRELALDGAALGKVHELEDPADCLAFVAETAGGVAPATMTYAVPRLRTLTVDGLDPLPQNVRSSRYPLTRPLLLVAREPPQGAVRELFDFMLSAEGQGVVARAGFVPAH